VLIFKGLYSFDVKNICVELHTSYKCVLVLKHHFQQPTGVDIAAGETRLVEAISTSCWEVSLPNGFTVTWSGTTVLINVAGRLIQKQSYPFSASSSRKQT
jgi:hypothetical protein